MAKSNVLEFVREDDYVQYFLFPPKTITPDTEPSEENELNQVLVEINTIRKTFTKDYLWHKDEFRLTTRLRHFNEHLSEEKDLPGHFHGISHFGDNIEDEWFIVALLYELTRQIPNLIVRVEDSDGEFLLIEAADHLPGWATPEKCENKVYIMNGHLHMIQRSQDISMADAVAELRQNPLSHKVSSAIELCVQERIKNYPQVIAAHQHRANAFVPVNVARLLHQNPNWVAASVQAFVNRDPIDLKAIRAMKFFPPEHRVFTPVRFSKCLYAMLLHQQYLPDRRTGWQLPPKTHADYKEAVLGMRLACGFEILVAGAQKRGPVGELDDSDKHWCLFLKSLTSKGYFRGLLENSREHNELKEAAKVYFLQNESNESQWTNEVGAEILKQLREIDSSEEHQFPSDKSALPASDDDNWMNVDAGELDNMMKQRYKGNMEDIELEDENQGENLANQLEEFLKMKSDYEGVDLEKKKTDGGDAQPMETTTEQKPSSSTIDFDPDMFANHVKNLLDFVIPEDNWHSEDSGDMSDYDGEEEAEKNNLDEDMTKGKMKLYMDAMDQELKGTTMGKSFHNGTAENPNQNGAGGESGEFDDIEEFNPVNIEMNTVKNMLQSYQSQLGGPGPTSNLLTSMGFNVKRSEVETEPELKEATV